MSSGGYRILPYAAEFWSSAEDGRLVVQHCLKCENRQLYPRRGCVACGGVELDYIPASGKGRLYSWSTVVRHAPPAFSAEVPYTVAIVALDEGPRILTRIVDAEDEALRCDMPVSVVFGRLNGDRPLPCFVAVEPSAGTSER